jgi:RHS repeat-associated protein
VYVFDGMSGRHLQTVRPLSGAIIYNFGYDPKGFLTTVTDSTGTTVIKRDSNENPTAIMSPYGQTTTLGVDNNGYLKQITDPAGNTITPTHDASGLLQSLKDANNNLYTFKYDTAGFGRLVLDSDPAGGSIQLNRTDNTSGFTVVKTTAAGSSSQPNSVVLTSTYQTTFSSDPSSTSQQFLNTFPTGLQATQPNKQQSGQLSEGATLPDGTASSQTLGADPRWGIQAPIPAGQTITLGNLTMNVSSNRTASVGTPGDPFSLTTQIDSTTINGKVYTSTYTAGARTYTFTTPAGRSVNTTLDSQERVISSGIAGLLPTTFCYDTLGRLGSVTKGARVVTLSYDSNGFLQSITPGAIQQSGPAVLNVTPANGATIVAPTSSVVLNFNLPLNPATVNASTVAIQTNGAAITGAYTVSGSTVSFAPQVPFALNITVTVQVNGGLKDLSCNPAQPFSSSFSSSPPSPPTNVNVIVDDRFTYWLDGHLKTRTLPDGRVISYKYDPNGNLSTLTLPSGAVHTFSPTPVNLLASYTPPAISGSGPTIFTYNADRQPALITRPDGQTITYNYEKNTSVQPAQGTGRLSSVVAPTATIGYQYDPTTGNLYSASVSGGEALTYGYNGPLPTSSTWKGSIAGSVSRTFDNNFRVQTQSINNGNAVSFGYDDDGFLQSAGALTITPPSQQNSWTTSTTLGNFTDSWVPDQYGQLSAYTASFNGSPQYKLQITPDTMGRISTKTETIAGKTNTYTYTYWPAGELKTVTLNGPTVVNYAYDPDSNMQPPTGTPTPAYDAQDRLLAWGNALYRYTANGELLTKSVGSQVTKYNYDVLGNLLSVTQPDGSKISYIIDPENRRVGKQVNGGFKQAFLYDGPDIMAELDVSGNIVSQFVYATKSNVPDYMIKGGVNYRIVSDNLGSPRLVVNTSNGQVAERIDYDTFGNVTYDMAPGFQPFGFAGGLYDLDTKLIRFGARDYDPIVGRWTAKDPILFAGGQTSAYEYALSDPVNGTDPLGLYGGGWWVGTLWEAGVGFGASGQASMGGGLFSGGGPVGCAGLNGGSFTSYGGFLGAGDAGWAAVDSTFNQVYGISGGMGGGIFATNAKDVLGLGGVSGAVNVSFLFLSFQYAEGSNGVWSLSAGVAKSVGLSISGYRIYTKPHMDPTIECACYPRDIL